MAYTTKNFKTKKDLKLAVQSKEEVTCYSPGIGPDLSNHTGTVFLEGPHFPEPHRWYANAQMENGIIVSVK